ncbi:hypothetical protein I316_03930 [Kwoniella heveanensis BCC8398]|uniref:Zn(2)-C6 fungal-type domain-containing protein n=1 Tax=Kwoniella heveanensis BCC8398 TaxID=1296120 RepID=A0A1B9GTS4_9TREE|nr:hypothetical protein I316_03930 [Kwoniella heveanensis BCC8398]
MSPFSTTTDRGGNGTGSGFERDLGHGYGHAPSQSAPQSQSQSPGRPEERYSQQDHSMNIDTGSAGHTPVKGPVKRPRQACTNCRALKTRCLPYGGGSMKSKDTCSRCAKYGLKCDYERKPRGKAGEADEPSAGPGDMPPALWESGTDGMPRPRDGAGQHFHYGVDEMKGRFRGNDCPSGNHGQGSHRSSESYSMKGAGVISSSEPSPSTWTAPRQPDVKPHISTSSSSSATFQSGPHVTQHADSSMQTAANMSNSPTGQPPTFYDIGNRTNSLGCPAVPTHIPPPQHQPQGDPQSFHQQDPSRSISSTYISSVDSAGRPMNGPNDYTSAYRVSGAPYLQTPLSTNSSNRPSTTDVRAHLPSTHPAAGGTYVRSRKTEISTLITDHLDPHLGRDDSRSPSPSRSRRYSAFDHPTTSSSSSRFQSRNSQTSKSGSARNSFVGRPASTPTRVTVHPIDLGMLSEPEARHLFHQFFTRLADIIACFDPAYTTYERARSSPALFTAMLFASARFFRPDISPTLRSHAEVLVNRAVTEGVFDLPTIQALLVLAYWKLPKDGTAYIKLGIAIRAACQLRLWKKRAGPLPQDEEEARAVLDRERTWMALVGMDRAYSHIFEQPVMVPNSELQLTDGETWAFEHEHLNITIDWYLAWHAW